MLWHDFFFQAEDGIRDLVRSRGLGDVYKRQAHHHAAHIAFALAHLHRQVGHVGGLGHTGHGQQLSLIHI